ncbi:MAG: hypothetical protein ACJ8KF_14390 [Chthoniobacterales bacterium]
MDDSHVYGRLAGKLVPVVLCTEDATRAGRHDRTPRLVAPVDHWCGRQVGGVCRRRTSDDESQYEKW